MHGIISSLRKSNLFTTIDVIEFIIFVANNYMMMKVAEYVKEILT